MLNSEEEIISQDELVKESIQDSDDVWMHVIDEEYLNIQQANISGTWVVESNPDALEEYMDDVILPEAIDSFDW